MIGRGLKSGENFELLYKLAEKLNAAGKRKLQLINKLFMNQVITKEIITVL